MTLPISRDETAMPNAPVRSALLNSIQDAIIGGKHAEVLRGYTPSMFTYAPGGFTNQGDALLALGAGVAYCGISVPVGDRITTVKWGYIVGASGSLTMRLCRRKIDGSAVFEAITPFSGTTIDNTGTTNETNLVTYNHTIAADYTYMLRIDVTNNATNFFGAILGHDRL